MINYTWTKLKVSVPQRHCKENEKTGHRLGENIGKSYTWKKFLYPEYLKNSQNSNSKQTTEEKCEKDLKRHFTKEDIRWQISTWKDVQ